MRTITIAIVGGGSVGTAILCQLNKLIKNKSSVRVVIYERDGELGPGLPYSTTSNHHIINLPAHVLSPYPDEPDHFVHWLKNNEAKGVNWKEKFPNFDLVKSACPAGLLFPPRELYGIYLKDIVKSTIAQLKRQGVEVQEVYHEVINVSPSNSLVDNFPQYELQLKNKTTARADYILLAVGHMESDKFVRLKGDTNYVHHPWPVSNYTGIPKDQPVCILGSRLTAIDIALALVESGHRGKITMVSRGGLIPTVIGMTQPYPLKYFTRQAIEDLSSEKSTTVPLKKFVELFEEEMSEVLCHTFRLNVFLKSLKRDPKIFLSDEIADVAKGERRWQSFLYAFYPLIPHIWQVLDQEDKKIFETNYASPLMTYLAAFPEENAKKVLKMLSDGKLEIKAGFEAIAKNGGNFEIKLDNGSSIPFHYVINGTGPGYKVEHSGSVLLNNLVTSGMLKQHPYGGVEVDFKTFLAPNQYGFYVFGEATRGVEWATTDLGTICRHIERGLFHLKKSIQSCIENMTHSVRIFGDVSSFTPETLMRLAENGGAFILCVLPDRGCHANNLAGQTKPMFFLQSVEGSNHSDLSNPCYRYHIMNVH